MTLGGNKGFASLVTPVGEVDGAPRRPPRSGFLGARENRLAELAAGSIQTRVHESVDPARCRIWAAHNRDYAHLSEESCADLIASLRAQGRQEVPAIVRRVSGDPVFQFEVICGARRHWSVSWLRAHDFPDFKFVVEPRELTDEEAFRVSDLENRSRQDLSDFERATDYARAVATYYDGNQQRMADRLQVTKSWLSRYLELAKLPPEVLTCFESPHAIGISHAAVLAPLLNNAQSRAKVLTEAAEVADEQKDRRESGLLLIPSAGVVARLTTSGRGKAKSAAREELFKGEDGKIFLRVRREGRAGVVFKIPSAATSERKIVIKAIEEYLLRIAANR